MQLVMGISLELTFKLFFILDVPTRRPQAVFGSYLTDNHWELVSNIPTFILILLR